MYVCIDVDIYAYLIFMLKLKKVGERERLDVLQSPTHVKGSIDSLDTSVTAHTYMCVSKAMVPKVWPTSSFDAAHSLGELFFEQLKLMLKTLGNGHAI